MGFSCGIVGLPNVGKSTLFNALARGHHAAASNYPFCTVEPNIGTVPVPDARLAKIAELAPKERVVPATIRFVDLAGLVKGASHGEGLGNQFLAQIAEVDAMVHVVRCFEDPQVAHVTGSVDPRRDIEIVNTELALRDLGTVSSAVTRLEKQAKAGEKKARLALELFQRIGDGLNQGRPARSTLGSLGPAAAARGSPALRDISGQKLQGSGTTALGPEELELVAALHLLTAKPLLYVANIAEDQIGRGDSPLWKAVEEAASRDGSPAIPICASIEAQIAALESEAERAEFLAAVGLKEPGLNRLIRAGYERLGLITFFTIVGTKEIRAWTLRKGATALEAAGKVHTDMSRGFIRAEVVSTDDFVACGSEHAAREQGRLRVEGKEYVVQDGEILHFRFSV